MEGRKRNRQIVLNKKRENGKKGSNKHKNDNIEMNFIK